MALREYPLTLILGILGALIGAVLAALLNFYLQPDLTGKVIEQATTTGAVVGAGGAFSIELFGAVLGALTLAIPSFLVESTRNLQSRIQLTQKSDPKE